jgi:serine protease AprX
MRNARLPALRPNLFLPLFLLACCLAAPAYSQGGEAPDQHVIAEIEEGRVTRMTSQQVPPAEVMENLDEPKFEAEASSTPPDKIHPRLREMIERGDSKAREQVIVNFRDTVKISRFPDLVPGEPRDSDANTRALQQTARMIKKIKNRRGVIHRKRMREMGPRFQLEFVRSFWLTDAMVLRMPLGQVEALAEEADVLYIAPEEGGEPPPIGDGNALNDVIDGREEIGSDPYFNLGLTGGFIGLLDTGMRFTHVQFNNPSHIGFRRDCVNGTLDYCTTGTGLNPNDDFWNHGTSSGAILTANANQGNDYRGVTAIIVDSFKVYSNAGLNATAAVRAFEAAVAVGDRVIVAEIQSTTSDTGPISSAADRAFDAGAAVIAANGNTPTVSTVAAPANAHKVIGVGAVDVASLTTIPQQAPGPAPDGRIKPDVQAPTNTETASNASDTALHVFTGTSGATPYAAGVAALFRNWLINQGATGNPGEVYVHLILSGQISWPNYNNTTGVGLLIMPANGTLHRGTVTVTTTGQVINIPIAVSAGTTRLDAALWWPETAAQTHNDIDLRLIDPSGVERAASRSGPSVFERAQYTGTLSGTWTLRISGFAVPTSPQTVYYAAFRR